MFNAWLWEEPNQPRGRIKVRFASEVEVEGETGEGVGALALTQRCWDGAIK